MTDLSRASTRILDSLHHNTKTSESKHTDSLSEQTLDIITSLGHSKIKQVQPQQNQHLTKQTLNILGHLSKPSEKTTSTKDKEHLSLETLITLDGLKKTVKSTSDKHKTQILNEATIHSLQELHKTAVNKNIAVVLDYIKHTKHSPEKLFEDYHITWSDINKQFKIETPEQKVQAQDDWKKVVKAILLYPTETIIKLLTYDEENILPNKLLKRILESKRTVNIKLCKVLIPKVFEYKRRYLSPRIIQSFRRPFLADILDLFQDYFEYLTEEELTSIATELRKKLKKEYEVNGVMFEQYLHAIRIIPFQAQQLKMLDGKRDEVPDSSFEKINAFEKKLEAAKKKKTLENLVTSVLKKTLINPL